MANDNWREEGSTLEFRNSKWEGKASMKNNVADMINGGYYWIKGIKSDVVEIAQYFHNDKGFYFCGDTSLYKLDKVEIVSYIGEQYFTWA